VLTANTMTRAHALDVLSADALLTYAFEAAADEPSRLTARADLAMQRIAALAEARGAAREGDRILVFGSFYTVAEVLRTRQAVAQSFTTEIGV